MSGNQLTSSTSESSDIKTKKKPPPPTNNSLLRVLRPKVYITDSLSFKSVVQELTGNGSPNPSSSPLQSLSPSSLLSSSPPTLPSIVMAEDRGRIEDTTSSVDDFSFGHQMLSVTSPDNYPISLPCDLDYVSFPSAASYQGVYFSHNDIESWILETEPTASVSVWYEHEPIDVGIYNNKIF